MSQRELMHLRGQSESSFNQADITSLQTGSFSCHQKEGSVFGWQRERKRGLVHSHYKKNLEVVCFM